MFRVGLGYDSHIFDASRPLMLGGVHIPDAPGLAGHSDADALIHAVIDALFGAAGKGDIGSHFPDTDAKWKGADSARLLESAVDEISADGWHVVNADAVVVTQTPKLSPHIQAIRKRLAGLLRCPDGCVSVKGKTNEGMDDIGRKVGLAVHAVVLIEKDRK